MERYQNYARTNASGDPAPGSTITVYQAGTLVLASIYSDNIGTPQANPFTSATGYNAGYFYFYAADGTYDVRISGTGVTTPYTWGDIQLSSPFAYRLSSYASLAAAVAAIGSAQATLLIDTDSTVATNTTVPATLALDFLAGNVLTVNNGITLTINGPLEAPLSQLFNTSSGGTVTFGAGIVPQVYPEWWGVVGNTGSFDTAAVQAAFNAGPPIWFSKPYYVTSVTLSGTKKMLHANRCALIGVSSTPATDSIFRWQAYNSEAHDISVDGNLNTNYLSAFHWDSVDAAHPAQYNNIFGLSVDRSLAAFVFGAQPGDTPINTAQSESTVWGFSSGNSCQNALYCSQYNGKLTLMSPQLIVSQGAWPGADFDYALGYCFFNDQTFAGCELEIHGGEIVTLGTAAIGMKGSEFRVIGTLFEVGGKHLIQGDNVYVSANTDGGVGGSMTCFTIDTGATGKMVLDNVWFSRPPGYAASFNDAFVDGTLAPTFHVTIQNSFIQEWRWSYVSNNVVGLVKGCKSLYRNVTYDTNVIGPVIIDQLPSANNITTADTTGASMSAVANQATKGAWVWQAGAGTFARSAVAPSGFNTSIILSATAADTSYIASPTGTSGFRVNPGHTQLFSGQFKTSSTGAATVTLYWYKFDGSASATPTTTIMDIAQTIDWFPLSMYVEVPADAAFAAIQLKVTNSTDLYSTDLRYS